MVLNPEVQKRAQAEIDRVVGTDRLPDFGDRVSIPYVEAVLRETMRFHPIAPLGVPHAGVSDDVYEGYPERNIYLDKYLGNDARCNQMSRSIRIQTRTILYILWRPE